MYSEILKKEKIARIENNGTVKPILGVDFTEDDVCRLIDKFCTKEDAIGVPNPKLLSLFDKFCEENGFACISHVTLGRIFRKHFGLTRKNVWNGGNLCWIYVPEK